MGSLALVLTASVASAQYSPLTISSGLNVNVIASGSSAPSSTQGTIDGTDVFYDNTYTPANAANFPNYTLGAFPASTSITNSSGVIYNLPAAGVNNGLLVNNIVGSGTLSFSDTGNLQTLYLLGTSSGSPLLTYTLVFAGGVQTDPLTFRFPDWYTGGVGDVNGLGRVGSMGEAADQYDGTDGNNFSLYTIAIPIPLADQSLSLESINIGVSDSQDPGSAVVFAASGGTVATPEPTPLVLAAVGVGLLAILRRRS